MGTFVKFLYEFMSIFFSGIGKIFEGLLSGIKQIFNINEYLSVVRFYSDNFGVKDWILVVVAIILVLIILGLIILLVWMILRKYIKFRKTC